jgi:hypothetical protein
MACPGISLTVQQATSKGFDLSVNLHVDDATRGGLGGWRNTLNFSPLERFSGIRWAGLGIGRVGATRLWIR